jgi:hypothetical protein
MVEQWNDVNSFFTEWIRSEFLISLMVCQLDFPNNPFRQFPKTHYSSPALAGFQHSNWGEAPDFDPTVLPGESHN